MPRRLSIPAEHASSGNPMPMALRPPPKTVMEPLLWGLGSSIPNKRWVSNKKLALAWNRIYQTSLSPRKKHVAPLIWTPDLAINTTENLPKKKRKKNSNKMVWARRLGAILGHFWSPLGVKHVDFLNVFAWFRERHVF